MNRIRLLWSAFRASVAFIQRYRQRKQERLNAEREERERERQHQHLMLDTIFSRVVEMQKASTDALLEVAKAQQAQADVLATWLKGFHTDSTPVAPMRAEGDIEVWEPLADVGELPPEFSLAFDLNRMDKLNQQELVDFDREGRDDI
jgi:hypothetical protein